jgi:transposase
LAASPELSAVAASVRAFAVIMNERRGRKLLEPWMTAAVATGEPALKSFVTGLRADQEAVTSGLSLLWSSGAVEATSTASRWSNDKCTDAPTPTCYFAAASSSPTSRRADHGNCARARSE